MKKHAVKFLSTISPNLVAKYAYKAMTRPQVKKFRDHELAFLDTAQKKKIRFDGFDIQTYKWGNPKHEHILLIHGWEGHAGNFTDLAKTLLENNYHVIAFDAPSHGFSSSGKTSLFEFSDLVAEMIVETGAQKLISHSFGGVATTYALYRNKDIEIDKYVLLTTPDKSIQRINEVAEFTGVNEKVKNKLVSRLEKDLNVSVYEANVSSYVKAINVKKPLIIHDKNDKVIPISYSRNVFNNWEGCQFKEVQGTGHFRILRTKEVNDIVVAFLNSQ